MNCPRCKHGAHPFVEGFYCGSCHAGFVGVGSLVDGEPLLSRAGVLAYEGRRPEHAVRGWLLLLSVLLLVATPIYPLLSKQLTVQSGLAGLPFVAFGLFLCFVTLRNQLARLSLQVTDKEITTLEQLTIFKWTRRVKRITIDGIWVQCAVGHDGPPDSFSLMCDEQGRKARTLLGRISSLARGIALAEQLAKQLDLPSDTRGSEWK